MFLLCTLAQPLQSFQISLEIYVKHAEGKTFAQKVKELAKECQFPLHSALDSVTAGRGKSLPYSGFLLNYVSSCKEIIPKRNEATANQN
ncbi:Dystrophin [Manis pentadactyla]|nr:Dystrophin [Manis pentadactyla]